MIIFANICFELFKNYEKILKLSFKTVKKCTIKQSKWIWSLISRLKLCDAELSYWMDLYGLIFFRFTIDFERFTTNSSWLNSLHRCNYDNWFREWWILLIPWNVDCTCIKIHIQTRQTNNTKRWHFKGFLRVPCRSWSIPFTKKILFKFQFVKINEQAKIG